MRNNEAVTAGAPGIILNYAPITEQPIDAYNIFDLAANWNFSDKLSFRAGITNLFDVEPETQYNPGRPTDVPLSSYCQGQAPGCLAQFSYAMPSRGGFNGGYYDTIGRRMFVGVKASF
jgi:outer membrane receptor protein involved in Fe transport